MNKTLTQTDLIAKLAEKTNITKIKAKELLEAFGAIILESIKNKEIVTIPILGKFVPKESAARSCRNPRTGEIMKVPAKLKMTFSASIVVKKTLEN